MELDIITQLILTLAPAITSIIGIVVSFVVGIKKIKKSNESTEKEVKEISDNDKFLRKQLTAVQKENAELKKQLEELIVRMKHLYFVEKTKDKEGK